MEWVRSRVSLQQQDREDDRIQEPRGRRVPAKVAVGQLLWGAFLLPFFLMLRRLPAWEESAWHEERKERCSRGKTAPARLDLKPQRCSWIILPESGGGAKRLMVSDKNYNTHTLPWAPRGELFINDHKYKSCWFPFACRHLVLPLVTVLCFIKAF